MAIDICATDFGVVRLDKPIRYMDSLDPNWREIVRNKRKKGRHARWLREQLSRVELAVATMAAVEHSAGGVLDRW